MRSVQEVLTRAWTAASRRPMATIVVALLITVAAVASYGRPSGQTQAPPQPSGPVAVTTPDASPNQSAVARESVSGTPRPSDAATPVAAAGQATPLPTPPTPNPTAPPTLTLVFSSLTSPVARGSRATATVGTNPASYCTIVVAYKSGPTPGGGLQPLTADASGVASWTWKVGPRTGTGSGPVTVTCSSSGLQKSVSRALTIT